MSTVQEIFAAMDTHRNLLLLWFLSCTFALLANQLLHAAFILGLVLFFIASSVLFIAASTSAWSLAKHSW